MASSSKKQTHSKSGEEGIQAVFRDTPSAFKGPHCLSYTFGPQESRNTSERSRFNDQKTSHCKIRGHLGTGILLPHFHGAKVVGRVSSGHRPVSYEQDSLEGQIRDGNISFHSSVHPTGGLRDVSIPSGCIFPHFHAQGDGKIPSFCLDDKGLSLCLPLFRSESGSIYLHYGCQATSSPSKGAGHSPEDVFGRLAQPEPITGETCRFNREINPVVSGPGLQYQSLEFEIVTNNKFVYLGMTFDTVKFTVCSNPDRIENLLSVSSNLPFRFARFQSLFTCSRTHPYRDGGVT